MAKRFTDTEIWDKEWFMSLSPKLKCFVKYVRDKCDISGIWHPNYLLAGVYIGEQVSESELLSIDKGRQFSRLPDGKIYCNDFVSFQYGGTLNPNSPVHKKVIDILRKYEVPIEIQEFKKSSFTPPTLDEIKNEFRTKLSLKLADLEAQKFLSYYESNGWKVGKNAMKSWKSAVVNWISRIKIDKPKADIKEKLKQIGAKSYSEM